ncbi:MAG: CapA family protein [Pararhodobacter sp.]|nr:CapA family protein [Pararhodobacter sp.]
MRVTGDLFSFLAFGRWVVPLALTLAIMVAPPFRPSQAHAQAQTQVSAGALSGAVCRPASAALPVLNACRGSDRISLAVVGDALLHRAVQRRGYALGFDTVWGAAAPYFHAADIAIANLEGPTAPGFRRGGRRGADPGPVFDDVVYQGYPLFNYHPTVIDALREAGVSMVTLANNHALDRASAGLNATMDELDARGMPFTGTIRPGAPRDFFLRVRTRMGVISFIACTYSTNGIPDPHRQVLMCFENRGELLAMVGTEAARPGTGGVVVLPHWGIEYSHRPEARQRALAQDLIAAGAMAVIGTHPHVVQPFETFPGPMGAGLVAYSTGNFVSAQRSLPRATGIMVWAEICPAPTGAGLALAGAGWLPLQMVVDRQGLTLGFPPAGAGGTGGQGRALVERVIPGHDVSGSVTCGRPARASRAARIGRGQVADGP